MDIVTRNLSELCTSIDHYEPYLYVVGVVTDTISLIGSLSVVLIYIFFKNSRNYTYSLIVQLAITNIVSSVLDFVKAGDIENAEDDVDALCIIQGFLFQFGTTASFLWTTIISWTLYATVVLNRHNVLEMLYKKVLAGYGIPLVCAAIPLITGDYGPAGHWCWISVDKNPSRANILRLVIFYVPLWVIIAFNFFSYYRVIRYLRTMLPDSTDTALVLRLRLYPLILIFCWIWSTIYQIYSFANCDANSEFLAVTSLMFGNLMGFLNAIAYGFNDNVKYILSDKTKTLCNWVTKPCQYCVPVLQEGKNKGRSETTLSNSYSDYGLEMRSASQYQHQMTVSTRNDLEMSFASGNSF